MIESPSINSRAQGPDVESALASMQYRGDRKGWAAGFGVQQEQGKPISSNTRSKRANKEAIEDETESP
jgi:hypothetical protein